MFINFWYLYINFHVHELFVLNLVDHILTTCSFVPCSYTRICSLISFFHSIGIIKYLQWWTIYIIIYARGGRFTDASGSRIWSRLKNCYFAVGETYVFQEATFYIDCCSARTNFFWSARWLNQNPSFILWRNVWFVWENEDFWNFVTVRVFKTVVSASIFGASLIIHWQAQWIWTWEKIGMSDSQGFWGCSLLCLLQVARTVTSPPPPHPTRNIDHVCKLQER